MDYTAQVRVLDDRPDANGYQSSGKDLPTFTVDAVSHGNARAIAHAVAEGWTHTRLLVTTCDVTSEAASVQTFTYYAKGWDAERVASVNSVRVTTSYALGGYFINSDPFAERDADSVSLFAVDGTNVLTVCKTSRGNWRLDSSDIGHNIPVSYWDVRRGSAESMIEYLAGKLKIKFDRVDSFDDTSAMV